MSKKRDCLEQFSSLTENHISKLKEAGITGIPEVASCNEQQLRVILDTTLNRAKMIITEARKSLPDTVVLTLKDMEKGESRRYHVSTGVSSIDNLLGGKGFQSGVITQIAGEFGCGKSQIALTACVRALNDGVVVVVDTEGTWRRERILQIAQHQKVNLQKVDENFRIIQPLSSELQASSIRDFIDDEGTRINSIMNLNPDQKIVLLVIDSLTGLFRLDYPGRGVLAQRQHHLAQYIKNIYLFARKNNCAVLVTNQVVHSPDPYAPGGGMKPIGGNIIGHACTVRTTIKKKRGLLRVLQMVDSAHLPVAEALFMLDSNGVTDYEIPK